MAQSSHKPMFRRADAYLALAVAALSLALWWGLAQHSRGQTAQRVVVEVDGQVYQELPLTGPQEWVIQQGEARNVVCVDATGAWMSQTNCPDEQCVRQGRITRVGSTLVCLPHRVVVRLEGAREDGLDAVVR